MKKIILRFIEELVNMIQERIGGNEEIFYEEIIKILQEERIRNF